MAEAVNLLHAYGGQNPAAIGMWGSEAIQARLAGRGNGLIGRLLDAAISNFNKGHDAHALSLLGISLHTIQDFYSHNVPLRDQQGRDLRGAALREDPRQLHALGIGSPEDNRTILEDDPNLDWRRYENARHRTADQLWNFRRDLQDDVTRGRLSSMGH